MISKYKHKNITWIDIERPTRNEIIDTVEEYRIPKLAGEELLTETLKSKVDYYEKQELIYLVLHFPFFDKKEKIVVEKEIDFLIGKNFLITTHYQEIEPFNNFSKIFENNSILDGNKIGENPGFLLFYILKELYKTLDNELDGIGVNLEKIEGDIFDSKERDAVNSISYVNRKIIRFKKALSFHGDIIRSVEPIGTDMFGSGFSFNMGMILSEYNKVNTTVAWYKEILNDMRDTNNTLLTTKTNETIKTLTIINFIMLPITLITQVFGMNVNDNIILIQTFSDFFVVIGAMVLTGLVMFVYFKGRKWL
ncbi:MAG: magnesium transporter [Patescibacteria group bacterium]|nr:magnesium transporter [Patescibacteria group bacterium]